MVTLKECRILSEEAWEKYGKNGIARKKCWNCFSVWKANGRKPEEEPPVFPPNFEENCPVCGQKLPHASIPFRFSFSSPIFFGSAFFYSKYMLI